jgi:hypothetical protein
MSLATARTPRSDHHSDLGIGELRIPLQLDEDVGALVNISGELIGINSQILSPTGADIAIGFAIPSNMVQDVMGQLLSTGKVRRG